jgi:methyl-accepting chemotaxis protein
LAFSDVKLQSDKAAALIDAIAQASAEQAEGVNQLNTGITELDKVTQDNAASAEQIASTAGELSSQSAQLSQIVEKLSVFVDGRRNGNVG